MRRFLILGFCLFLTSACFKTKESASVSDKTPLLAGSISIKPELSAKADPLSVIFVMARTPDGRLGAVKKILPPFQFPVNFQLASEDLMIPGMDLQGPLTASARLDADGDANPPQPGDILGKGLPEPAPLGHRTVQIELNEWMQ